MRDAVLVHVTEVFVLESIWPRDDVSSRSTKEGKENGAQKFHCTLRSISNVLAKNVRTVMLDASVGM